MLHPNSSDAMWGRWNLLVFLPSEASPAVALRQRQSGFAATLAAQKHQEREAGRALGLVFEE